MYHFVFAAVSRIVRYFVQRQTQRFFTHRFLRNVNNFEISTTSQNPVVSVRKNNHGRYATLASSSWSRDHATVDDERVHSAQYVS